jgi:RNA polymerase sigma-70 factor, ECF subfamily
MALRTEAGGQESHVERDYGRWYRPDMTTSSELAGGLLAITPKGTPLFEERAGLEALLGTRWDEARKAWPNIDVPADVWLGAIAGALDQSSTLRDVEALHTTDVYLAQACAMGNALALAGFDETYKEGIEASLRTMGLADAAISNVARDVRKLLFEGAGGPPRIATYSGRAALATWTRTVTTRAAMRRLSKGSAAAAEPEATPAPADASATQDFRATHGTQVNDAFDDAMASLDLKQRNVLRHHFVEDLSLDDISEMYNVPKSTATRWLEEARAALAKRTHARFFAKVTIADADKQQITQLLDQSIESNLRRTLLN